MGIGQRITRKKKYEVKLTGKKVIRTFKKTIIISKNDTRKQKY